MAETRIAMEDSALETGILQLGEPSPYTCPECPGVFVQLREGGILRCRCHTGHAFWANTLLDAVTESIDDSLWSTIRGIEESSLLMRHIWYHLIDIGDAATAKRFEQKAREADRRKTLLRSSCWSTSS